MEHIDVILQIIYKPYPDNLIYGKLDKYIENVKLQHSWISKSESMESSTQMNNCWLD